MGSCIEATNWMFTSRRMWRPSSLLWAASLAACLPTGPTERVVFALKFEQPYRVPIGGVARPWIEVTAQGRALEQASYRLEADGILRVDSTGQGLSGLSRGTAQVRATYATATGTADTVFDVQVVVSKVEVNSSLFTFTRLRDSIALTATALDAGGAAVWMPGFRWSSSNPAVATVDSSRGIVTAVDDGVATITAEVDGVPGTVWVSVSQVAARVQVAPELDTVRTVGRSTTYWARAFDSAGRAINTAKASWSSSDTAVATVVATVTGAGLVTARGPGTALLITRVGTAVDTARLVVAPVVRFLFVEPPLDTLSAIDDTTRVGGRALDSLGSPVPDPPITWAVSDTSVATVSSAGLVRAKKNGAVVVTATSGRVSAFATVVVHQKVAAVRIQQDTLALLGEGANARLDATGFDRNGYQVTGAAQFSWASPLDLVATVDSTGLVTARGDGTIRITASSLNVEGAAGGAPTDTVTVIVTGAPQELIAFQSERGIEAVRPDGSGRGVLIHNYFDGATPEGQDYVHPEWSPDGAQLAVTGKRWDWGDCSNDNCRDVYTVSSGTDTVNLTKGFRRDWSADMDDAASWSPDGTQIALASTRECLPDPYSCSHVYVMNADGSNVRRLTDVPGWNPAWSPDGTRIAFERLLDFWYDERVHEIYVVNADGTGAVNLTSDAPGDGRQPAWSPDGSQLAFVTNRSGRTEIWLMNPDGTGARSLTSDPAVSVSGEASPVWSPDGTRIAFVVNSTRTMTDEWGNEYEHTDTDIYVMRVDGTDVRRVTSTDWEDEGHPTWRAAAPLNWSSSARATTGPPRR